MDSNYETSFTPTNRQDIVSPMVFQEPSIQYQNSSSGAAEVHFISGIQKRLFRDCENLLSIPHKRPALHQSDFTAKQFPKQQISALENKHAHLKRIAINAMKFRDAVQNKCPLCYAEMGKLTSHEVDDDCFAGTVRINDIVKKFSRFKKFQVCFVCMMPNSYQISKHGASNCPKRNLITEATEPNGNCFGCGLSQLHREIQTHENNRFFRNCKYSYDLLFFPFSFFGGKYKA